MLDCEPLHDLKGHIQNLIDEVPSKLNKQLEMEVKQLNATDLSKGGLPINCSASVNTVTET